MQIKLTKEDIGKLKQARYGIAVGFPWTQTDEKLDYWQEVIDKLDDKIKHGTSDGKPWVEPELPIPKGWRRATADEWQRKDVKFWCPESASWDPRLHQGLPFVDPSRSRRVYIVPIDDPPLTDQDAKERPWVMVADERNRWMRHPKILLSAPPTSARYVVVDDVKDTVATSWEHARRATTEEIEAAK